MTNKKTIAFDIDGVLTDYGRFIVDEGSKHIGHRIKNDKGYEIAELFEIESDEDSSIWSNGLIHKYVKEYPSRKYTAEVMAKLREKYNVYIITNRSGDMPDSGDISKPEMERIVLKWLDDEGILFDKIFFNKGSKLKCCLDNQVDIMIEDDPGHLGEISAHIPMICFDAKYNEHVKGDNIHRCYSMYDLLKICESLL